MEVTDGVAVTTGQPGEGAEALLGAGCALAAAKSAASSSSVGMRAMRADSALCSRARRPQMRCTAHVCAVQDRNLGQALRRVAQRQRQRQSPAPRAHASHLVRQQRVRALLAAADLGHVCKKGLKALLQRHT
jgi:hypothetical protein